MTTPCPAAPRNHPPQEWSLLERSAYWQGYHAGLQRAVHRLRSARDNTPHHCAGDRTTLSLAAGLVESEAELAFGMLTIVARRAGVVAEPCGGGTSQNAPDGGATPKPSDHTAVPHGHRPGATMLHIVCVDGCYVLCIDGEHAGYVGFRRVRGHQPTRAMIRRAAQLVGERLDSLTWATDGRGGWTCEQTHSVAP